MTTTTDFFFFSSRLLSSRYLLQLPPCHNSDPGSHSRHFPPLPTTVSAFVFIARRVQHLLASNCAYTRCLRDFCVHFCTRKSPFEGLELPKSTLADARAVRQMVILTVDETTTEGTPLSLLLRRSINQERKGSDSKCAPG